MFPDNKRIRAGNRQHEFQIRFETRVAVSPSCSSSGS